MNAIVREVLEECIEIMARNPKDVDALKEQKRIFNKYVNILIKNALDEKP